MASYIPQVVINKEFTRTSTAAAAPLHACVVGPHARLVRYGEPAERALGLLGPYDPGADEVFPWPGVGAGETVDLAYTRLFAADAKVSFFHHATGGSATAASVLNRPNYVRLTGGGAGGFRANGDAHPRMAGLYGRDVQKGDRVRVSATVAGTPHSLDSYVLDFASTPDAAVVASATADAGNKATQAAGSTVALSAGSANCWDVECDHSTWYGLPDGLTTEVYTVAILTASTGNDPTTATASITSASGLDDVASFSPAAADAFQTLGRRGFKFKFVTSGGPCNLAVGQAWQVTVRQAYTAVTPVSGGAYAGPADDVYVVEVTRGGLLNAPVEADRPQWRVTTARGLDASGPATLAASPSAKPIGGFGTTLSVGAATALARGERFYVPVTAQKTGVIDQLVLGDPLPAPLRSAPSLDLKLYVQEDREVPRGRQGYDPLLNYEALAGGIAVESGLTVQDPRFVDGAGAPLDLPVLAADLYAEFRSWLPGLDAEVSSAADLAALSDLLPGAVHPDNPLKYAVARALGGSGGVAVRFASVPDPDDPAGWEAAVGLLVGRRDVYNIVPLTHDPAIQALFHVHVAATTAPGKGVDQALAVGLRPAAETAVAVASTADAGDPILATISDDPNSTGTQYTLVQVPLNDAGFVARGVRAGDELRYAYATSYGLPTRKSAVVARVLSENSLLIKGGAAAAVAAAARVEVWRKPSTADLIADLAAKAGGFGSSRVIAVWSDLYDAASPSLPSYYLAAAIAGLTSGALPHAGLTNVEVLGFGDSAAARGFLNEDQAAELCGSGVWLVSRTPEVDSAAIVTRLATTTDPTSVETREEMVRRNTDSMARQLRARLRPYLGTTNVTESAASLLRVEVDAVHKQFMSSGWTQRLGAQLIAGSITRITQDEVFADQFDLDVEWTLPAPLNKIVVNLRITI